MVDVVPGHPSGLVVDLLEGDRDLALVHVEGTQEPDEARARKSAAVKVPEKTPKELAQAQLHMPKPYGVCFLPIAETYQNLPKNDLVHFSNLA